MLSAMRVAAAACQVTATSGRHHQAPAAAAVAPCRLRPHQQPFLPFLGDASGLQRCAGRPSTSGRQLAVGISNVAAPEPKQKPQTYHGGKVVKVRPPPPPAAAADSCFLLLMAVKNAGAVIQHWVELEDLDSSWMGSPGSASAPPASGFLSIPHRCPPGSPASPVCCTRCPLIMCATFLSLPTSTTASRRSRTSC